METNNQELISNIAINLLEMPIRKKDIDILGIIHHPFFNNTFIPYNDELIDITKDKDKNKFNSYIKDLKKYIKKEQDIYKIMLLINKPYKLFFLSLIKNYLDEETFATLLKECYTETEFPNHDINVPVESIKKMFQKANRKFLMDIDEQNILSKFNDELTIYRGFYSDKYYNALSWTLDIEKAHLFATRFGYKGSIYQANINKENIYAYFDCRNEKEVIVDYDRLYNISKKEQFS